VGEGTGEGKIVSRYHTLIHKKKKERAFGRKLAGRKLDQKWGA